MTVTSVQAYVQGNYGRLRNVPRRGWFTHPVAGIKSEGLSKAKRVNFLDAVTKLRTTAHSSSPHTEQITIWTMTDEARSCLESYEAEQRKMQMPCGHAGFRNTGDFLTCKKCGGRFTKDEVREYEP